MSDIYAVKTMPGYEGLGTGNAGSTSAMAWFDKYTGTVALMLDYGIGSIMTAHCVYDFSVDGGATGVITPKASPLIPAGAIMLLSVINATTAPAGSGNISFGTSAGSSATAILAATAYNNAIFATDAGVNVGAILPTSGNIKKMTAQGNMTVTLSGTLTAGVVEAFVLFIMPKNI